MFVIAQMVVPASDATMVPDHRLDSLSGAPTRTVHGKIRAVGLPQCSELASTMDVSPCLNVCDQGGFSVANLSMHFQISMCSSIAESKFGNLPIESDRINGRHRT